MRSDWLFQVAVNTVNGPKGGWLRGVALCIVHNALSAGMRVHGGA